MAVHDTVDPVAFRALFPFFANNPPYTDALIQMFYTNAACYIDNNDNFCGLNGPCLEMALMLMTAHLLYGFKLAGMGQTNTILTSATIDKVAVSMQPPPATTGWQWWLATSPYGQQLWALLSAQSVGGWSVGGRPETRAFRKVGGFF